MLNVVLLGADELRGQLGFILKPGHIACSMQCFAAEVNYMVIGVLL